MVVRDAALRSAQAWAVPRPCGLAVRRRGDSRAAQATAEGPEITRVAQSRCAHLEGVRAACQKRYSANQRSPFATAVLLRDARSRCWAARRHVAHAVQPLLSLDPVCFSAILPEEE